MVPVPVPESVFPRTPSEIERDERLIDQAWGNIRIEHPEVTREQVAHQLLLKRAAEAANASIH